MRSLILASVFLLALSILFAIACGDDDDDDDDGGLLINCETFCEFWVTCFEDGDPYSDGCIATCEEHDWMEDENLHDCFRYHSDTCDEYLECMPDD